MSLIIGSFSVSSLCPGVRSVQCQDQRKNQFSIQMLSRIISKSRILRTLTTKAAPPAVTADNNTEVDDTKPPGDRGWTKGEFHSVEDTLNKHIPPKELEEVKRVLYGLVSLLFFFRFATP